MKVALLIAFVVSLVIYAVFGGRPRPAFVSYSGCRLKTGPNVKGCACVSNKDIQIGETWANTRVQGQLSGFFVANPPTAKNYKNQGGPYGTGTGCACNPQEVEMVKSNTLADFCFFWKPNGNAGNAGNTGKGGKGGKNSKNKNNNATNTTTTIPKAPGEEVIPPPIVCPSNLDGCYSANYYEPGGPLAGYATQRPTYRGPWFPPKDKSFKDIYCSGFFLGCPAPTNADLQRHRLPKVGCDVSKCSPPPSA